LCVHIVSDKKLSAMSKHNGRDRFEFYLIQIEEQLLKASKEKNPALWLYANGARTNFFMLESLAKLYENIHNANRFEKIKELVKSLEDILGAVDYYDAFAKEFTAKPLIPSGITSYLQDQAREKLQSLNEVLLEKKMDWRKS